MWRRKRQPTPVFMPGKSHGPGGLHSMGLQRVRHDWVTSLHDVKKWSTILSKLLNILGHLQESCFYEDYIIIQ